MVITVVIIVNYTTIYTDCNGIDFTKFQLFNPLNAELNRICHLLALLGAHPILHVTRIRVKGVKGSSLR
jgi:hypothetical protein